MTGWQMSLNTLLQIVRAKLLVSRVAESPGSEREPDTTAASIDPLSASVDEEDVGRNDPVSVLCAMLNTLAR